jgi:hypothetical protein
MAGLQERFIAHQLDLLRVEAGMRTRAIGLLNQLQAELRDRLRLGGELSKLSKARLNKLLKDSTEAVDDYYADIQGTIEEGLTGVATNTARVTAKNIEQHFVAELGAGLPSATYLSRVAGNILIMGAPSSEWWARQSQDVAFRFANAVRQGITAGDTNESIVARIAGGRGYPGIMDTSRANVRSLVHTSIQAVANDARRETYRANDDIIEGTRQVSTLDGHTTDICIAYDGAEYDLDGEPMAGTDLPYEGGVPRHWGCRSVEVPITKSFKELGIDAPEPPEGQRASAGGPVPASQTFEDFLSTRTEAQQDEQLGKGRAEMWRNGDITLSQLLDLRGNPLTLEELEEKYG